MARTVDRPDRPQLESRQHDDLMRINAELLAELWILRDRVTILEQVLADKGLVDRKALDDFQPVGALAEELTRERQALVRRVMGAPHATRYDLEALKKKER
jgi:hypothetical protein